MLGMGGQGHRGPRIWSQYLGRLNITRSVLDATLFVDTMNWQMMRAKPLSRSIQLCSQNNFYFKAREKESKRERERKQETKKAREKERITIHF